MLYLIGLKNCDTTRKARKWLEERRENYAFVDLQEEPLSNDEIDELVFKVGLDTLVNKRSRTYRDLKGDESVNMESDEALKQALTVHQKMIKRPVLVRGESVLVGFDEDSWASFLQPIDDK